MSSMTSWGRSNLFPSLEYTAFFKGFQNPRIPSYFSNTHLITPLSVKNMMAEVYGSQKNTNWWDWWKNWWKSKHWWVPQYPQPPWLVYQRIQEEGNHWWEFLLPPSTLCESDLVDVIWLLLLNCVFIMLWGMKRWRAYDGWRLPFELSVPPTRDSDQCDSGLSCEFLFHFISSLLFS